MERENIFCYFYFISKKSLYLDYKLWHLPKIQLTLKLPNYLLLQLNYKYLIFTAFHDILAHVKFYNFTFKPVIMVTSNKQCQQILKGKVHRSCQKSCFSRSQRTVLNNLRGKNNIAIYMYWISCFAIKWIFHKKK